MIYGAADIIRRFVGFIMLPIYTRYLTPADYGVVQLMLVAVSVMEVFLGMRMGQAIFRYYYMAKDAEEKKAVMSTAFLITFAATTVAFIVLATNAGTATKLALGDMQYTDLMKVFAITLIVQAVEAYGFVYIRVHQQAKLFFGASVFKLIIQLALNIYLIIILKMSVAGVIYSSVISTTITAVLATIYTFYHSGFKFSLELAKKMIVFSFPLWITALGMVYLNTIDKYLIRVFSSIDAVGLYALAGKFGMLIIILVWSPFSNVWQSMRYEVYELPDRNLIYRRFFIVLILILSLAGLGISMFSDVVIRLMADKSFWPASPIVPFIVIASIVKSLAYFNNLGILLKEKTSIIAVGTYINAFVITVSLVIFVKLFGAIGAALSYMIGALFQLFWIESSSRKLYDMELPWKRAVLINATWLVCYGLSFLLPESLPVAIAGKLLLVILFVVLMYYLPILKQDEKAQIVGYVRGIFNRTATYFAR